MKIATYLTAMMVMCTAYSTTAATPVLVDYQSPTGMVYGGEFIDLILPVEPIGALRSDVWGAESTKPRDILNGLEDPEYSYWGGDIMYEEGKYHMFTCRWREDNVVGDRSGHMTWGSSDVVHAVADNPIGPYKFVEYIGKGHNPEIYKSKDGRYFVGGLATSAYVSNSINGPWREIDTEFQWLRRPNRHPNRTYVDRGDGSSISMSQRGLFYSDDSTEDLIELIDTCVYRVIGDNGAEDPVIWRDEVQYHCIYNGPRIRSKAFYMRSKDGIRWKLEKGVAYDADVVNYTTAKGETWYKLERPKVIQDKYGRATHIHLAAMDTLKWFDVANDIHSSKNVVLPLRVPRRLEVLNRERVTSQTPKIDVKILAEEGFDPIKDVDVSTLKFGAPESIDFGGGAKATKSTAKGDDLVVTFEGENGFEEHNFAGKLLGYDTNGELLFGYAKMLPSATDLQDEIMLQTIQPEIPQSGKCRFVVNYKTKEPRSLAIDFVDVTTGEVLSSDIVKDVKGEDLTLVHFESPTELDMSHKYRFELYLTELNKKERVVSPKVKKDVDVLDPTAPEEIVDIVAELPKDVSINGVIKVPVKYVTRKERHIEVVVIKSKGIRIVLEPKRVATVNGEGVADVEICLEDYDIFEANSLCTLQFFLTDSTGGENGRISYIKAANFNVIEDK